MEAGAVFVCRRAGGRAGIPTMSLPAFYEKKRKQKAGKAGFPEYTAVVGDFVLVMEDKADCANLCLKEADGTISMTVQATTDYAVNGALHYAQHILQKTTYKKVFAFGNAGDSKHHTLQPLFVDKNGYKWLPEVQTFENFSAAHIVEYYKQIVLEETPPEDIELAEDEIVRNISVNIRFYEGWDE